MPNNTGLEYRLVTEGSFWRENKFGQDRPGGGSSKEPFVNRDTLPGLTDQSPDLGLLGGNSDFLLRAGTLKRQVDDVSRITQLLLTTGKGVAFTAKQNLLSRTNVKTQAESIGLNQGPYLPTSTIAQVGVSGLGFHLNKQGVNPFAKTGEDGSAGTTGIDIVDNIISAGALPTYLSANVKGGNNGESNRLVQLTNTKLYNTADVTGGFLSGGSRLLSNIAGAVGLNSVVNKIQDSVAAISQDPLLRANSISSNRDEILAYGGGPGAELGVGRTIIKRYSDSTGYYTESFRKNYFLLDGGFISGLATEAQKNPGQIRTDFRQYLIPQSETDGAKKNIISESPDYTRKNIEQRVGLGNPGTSQKDLRSYSKGTGNGAVDKVNALPLYSSKGVTANSAKNDLVKFRIAAYNPHDDAGKKTYIHFRAFLDNFSDSYNSIWDNFKYMGRTEDFHKFQGFTRNVSLGWKVVAQSREELIIMYKKLNYLQSIMTGDYSPSGYMEGNIVNLTVGGYFWEQPGFFTSLNVTFPEKATYEIGIPDPGVSAQRNSGQNIDTRVDVKEVPHYLDVTAAFTPIQNFAPRKQQNEFDNKGQLKSYGKERFINLSAESGKTSYDVLNSSDTFDPTSTSNVSKAITSDQGKIDQFVEAAAKFNGLGF